MSKQFSLGELAELLGATLQGDASVMIKHIASIENAGPEDISFVSSAAYVAKLSDTRAGAIILKAEHAESFSGNALVSDNPYLAYARASAIFDPRPTREAGIHPSAVISESAQIASTASIGAHCVIGENVVIGEHCELYPGVVVSENSSLGDHCLLYSNVSIYANVRIGSKAIIHSGAVIGSDGFGFAPSSEGWVKIHQLGGVVIGDRVEIGAGSAIDCGAIGDTIIHDGVIIDNQVHIAHNIEICENTAIAALSGMAGSTKIGKNCTLAGGVLVNGHIEITDNCHFNGGTVVTKGIREPGVYSSGTPMMEVKQWRKAAVRFGQLDDLSSRIKTLEKTQK